MTWDTLLDGFSPTADFLLRQEFPVGSVLDSSFLQEWFIDLVREGSAIVTLAFQASLALVIAAACFALLVVPARYILRAAARW